ncbi:galactokinase family protein [Frankia sp. QA3]|uniref:galactokinase n=1 Tax=Frankia sp. QA3 TaxID=710111 RepID=UPI000269CD1E|nr:galactokinase family protein [Frankia sp. QA3]EIV96088.1 galactokinase [Frankia sp. QA3]
MAPPGRPDPAGGSGERAVPAALRAVRAFKAAYGGEPTHLVRSPARVNLIGEHTDYNDGLCLPVAIDRELCIALRRTDDAPAGADRRQPGGSAAAAADDDGVGVGAQLRLVSEQDPTPAVVPLPPPAPDTPPPARATGWARYVQGVAVQLAATGQLAGAGLVPWQGALASDIPLGAGLSSSAALELAVALACTHLAGSVPAPTELARLAQRAENAWVGAATGLLDQLACVGGIAGHALRIDCRALTVTPVPLPAGLAIVVIDTGSRRELVTSAYADRRADCERAARALGVPALRDLDALPADAAGRLDPAALRRARFVIAENARVDAVAGALAGGDAEAAGRLLLSGHRGIRDDFEVSGPELDAAVAAASAAPGCFGARMTGGGFAGCAVALVDRDRLDAFTAAFEPAYSARAGREAVLHVCSAVAGTSVTALR